MGFGMDELEVWSEADEPTEYGVNHVWEVQAKSRYSINKKTKVGDVIECACCGKLMTKKSYQSQFCSNNGSDNCKDNYWNRVDGKRFKRALSYKNR